MKQNEFQKSFYADLIVKLVARKTFRYGVEKNIKGDVFTADFRAVG